MRGMRGKSYGGIFRLSGILSMLFMLCLIFPFSTEGARSNLYYVQFGIYSTLKEALNLFNNLNERGESISIYTIESEKGKQLYAIVSGAYASREDAARARENYKKKYSGIRGITIAATGVFKDDPLVSTNTPPEAPEPAEKGQKKVQGKKGNIYPGTNTDIASSNVSKTCEIQIKSPLSKSVLLGSSKVYLEALIANCSSPQVIIVIDGTNIYDLPEEVQISYKQNGDTWVISGVLPFRKELERHGIEVKVQQRTFASTGSVVFYNN